MMMTRLADWAIQEAPAGEAPHVACARKLARAYFRRVGISHNAVLRSERDHWRKRANEAEHENAELHKLVQSWLATDIRRDEYEAQDEGGA